MCTPALTPTENAVGVAGAAWSTATEPQAKHINAVPHTATLHRFTGPVYLRSRAACNQGIRRPLACAQSGVRIGLIDLNLEGGRASVSRWQPAQGDQPQVSARWSRAASNGHRRHGLLDGP